jgi:hypothetical protein
MMLLYHGTADRATKGGTTGIKIMRKLYGIPLTKDFKLVTI